LNQGPIYVPDKKQSVSLPPPINKDEFQALSVKKSKAKIGKKISPFPIFVFHQPFPSPSTVVSTIIHISDFPAPLGTPLTTFLL
jgi:hypothetical protein